MVSITEIRERAALMRELRITKLVTPELTLELDALPPSAPTVSPETAEKIRQKRKEFDDALLFASAEGFPE